MKGLSIIRCAPFIAVSLLAASTQAQECQPQIVGSLINSETRDVKVVGNIAYLGDAIGLFQSVDVSDPTNPVVLDSLNFLPDDALGIAIVNNRAYVADGDFSDGLKIVDISNPSDLSLITSASTPNFAQDVFISGNLAYIADNDSGLQIMDISEPLTPSIIGSVDVSGLSALSVQVRDNVAYVAGNFGGLQIFDVSDPEKPTSLSSANIAGQTLDVAISGEFAYIAHSVAGFQVFDISNPANPMNVGGVSLPGSTRAIAVSGNLAFAAGSSLTFSVIDISIPTNPTVINTVTLPDTIQTQGGITTSGGLAFIADDDAGLQIIDYTTCVEVVLGDLNSDGVVNGADLANLLAAWGPATPGAPEDLNDDGVINGADLATLLANWS